MGSQEGKQSRVARARSWKRRNGDGMGCGGTWRDQDEASRPLYCMPFYVPDIPLLLALIWAWNVLFVLHKVFYDMFLMDFMFMDTGDSGGRQEAAQMDQYYSTVMVPMYPERGDPRRMLYQALQTWKLVFSTAVSTNRLVGPCSSHLYGLIWCPDVPYDCPNHLKLESDQKLS